MQVQRQQTLSQTPPTPLVNLFAYLRDLYHTAPPETRFDATQSSKASDAPSWYPLGEILTLAQQTKALGICQWQDQREDLPLLTLKRVEAAEHPPIPQVLQGWVQLAKSPNQSPVPVPIPKRKVAFDASADRVKAFKSFDKSISGQKLEDVQDLHIPTSLTLWIELDEKEGHVIVQHKEKAYERFEESESRVTALNHYTEQCEAFFEGEGAFSHLNEWYETLHNWLYQLKANPDLQLTLSFGLFSGGKGKQHYRNYLFHVPLSLQLLRQELSISLQTADTPITCEQHFCDLIPHWFPHESEHLHEQRRMEVIRRIDQFNAKPHTFTLDPEEIRASYYHPAMEILDVFPRIQDQFFVGEALDPNWKAPIEGEFSFSFSPILQLREPGNQIHIARDAAQIIKEIHELTANGKHELVPAFFQKLFSLKQRNAGIRIAFRQQDRKAEQLAVSEAMEAEFNFPLPYNEEQLAIARRLTHADAATVQGPPGTGKSHTIANLAAHFASLGQSVLIVSKYAKALEVIREKLPASLQELAVCFSDDEHHREQLKHAIDAVKARLAAPVPDEALAESQATLDQLRVEADTLEQAIKQQLAAQRQRVALYNPLSGTAITQSLAAWAYQYEELAEQVRPLPDSIGLDADITEWAKELFPILAAAQTIDPSLCDTFWPAPETLPSPEAVSDHLARLSDLVPTQYTDLLSALPAEAFHDDLIALWQAAQAGHAAFIRHQHLIDHPHFDIGELCHLLRKVKPIFEQHQATEQDLMYHDIQLGPVGKWALQEAETVIGGLLSKFPATGPLSRLKKATLSRQEKVVLACTVNGLAVSSKTDLRLVQTYLQQQGRERTLRRWAAAYLTGFDQTIDKTFPLTTWAQWSAMVEAYRHWEAWENQISQYDEAIPTRAEEMESALAFGEAWAGWQTYRQQADMLKAWSTRIPSQGGFLTPLRAALLDHDATAYGLAYDEYVSLSQEALAAKEVLMALDPWQTRLPHTVQQMLNHALPEYEHEEALRLAMHHAQLGQMLMDEADRPLQSLIQSLDQTQVAIQEQIVQHIRLQTWAHKQQTLTDAQKSALSAWRNDLINLGKGFGKNSAQHQQSAIQNLKLAREVVPIWIMSQESAIRFFPDPTPAQFDLLIIDEASQVDISALNLIFRAKKVLIVGDENQTSVHTHAALFPIERTNQILDRYLGDHPFKQQFHLNNRTASIYSLSGVIYPNIISLKEHFRCRPEIISFSNEYVYNQHIVPLRMPAEGWYGAPAEVHYIEEDQSKDKKRPKLVAAVVGMIEHLIDAYHNGELPKLPTIGVLCLDSSNEVHREYLQAQLQSSALIRRHSKAFRILVGTPREFQGDERDIMILTSTALHTTTKTGKIRPPRAVKGEEMMRIYNVAVSRARDKVILLHGIHPEAVALMQPQCFRGRLIRHLGMIQSEYTRNEGQPLRAHPHTQLSPWQQTVFEVLQQTFPDTTLVPKYSQGRYEIDLAGWHHGKPIALFCDEGAAQGLSPEQQWQQQAVLSRTGWSCFRISAKDWHLNRDQVLAQVQAWMASLTNA